jgi:hypothetical protein
LVDGQTTRRDPHLTLQALSFHVQACTLQGLQLSDARGQAVSFTIMDDTQRQPSDTGAVGRET